MTFSICHSDIIKQAHLFVVDDFASGALELPELTQEIPKPRLGDDVVWGENSHLV